MTKRNANWNGMNWIRQEKRLAIYLRDGLCCAYCGATVENGTSLSLDHLTPASKGGTNDAANLVTCCSKCNSSRQDRPVATFAEAVAGYTLEPVAEILKRIRRNTRRHLGKYLTEAKAVIARRGSAAQALASN